jgi:hypothetical protein
MHIPLTPFFVLWLLLAFTVLGLAVYRKLISGKEDENLHLADGPQASTQQVVVAHKLDVIDKWGKLLTVVAVAYGLLLVAIYTYQTWLSAGTTTGL